MTQPDCIASLRSTGWRLGPLKSAILGALFFFLFLAALSGAAVPRLVSYQGRVAVNGVNFDGNGLFKFALVDAAGTTTLWSNDGTSTGGAEPSAAVTIAVTKGLYTVLLGDATIADMSAIPDAAFENDPLFLRVWFDDGTNGSQQITPDQRIAATAFAVRAGFAESVADGSVTSAMIADGAVTPSKVAQSFQESSNSLFGVPNSGGTVSPTFAEPFESPPLVELGVQGLAPGNVTGTGFDIVVPPYQLPIETFGVGDSFDDVSMAIVNGNPAVAFRRVSTGELRFARASAADGSAWNASVLADGTGDVGRFASLAVVAGNPAIAYYDVTGKNLLYVRATDADGTAWGTPAIVDSAGDVGQFASLAIVSGSPAIGYYDATNGALKYARATDSTGAGWGAPIVVDDGTSLGSTDVGKSACLVVVATVGIPAIAYYDATNSNIVISAGNDFTGSAWSFAGSFDSEGNSLAPLSLAVVNNSTIAATYFKVIGSKEYLAYSTISGGGIKLIAPIDVDSVPGDRSVGLIDVNGLPVVTFVNSSGKIQFTSGLDSSGISWEPLATVGSSLTRNAESLSMVLVNGRAAVAYDDDAFSNADIEFSNVLEIPFSAVNWSASLPTSLRAASVVEGGVTRQALDTSIFGSSLVEGKNAFAAGASSRAVGDTSTAFGSLTEAFGVQSFASGSSTRALGVNSFTSGSSTQALGANSFAAGNGSIASGTASAAFGDNTIASGLYSAAFGDDTTASAFYSTAFGTNTTASGSASAAFGNGSTASGVGAVSFGRDTEASGDFSIATGSNTFAESFAETVFGRFDTGYSLASAGRTSWNASDRLFVIGNGTNDSNRADALVMLKDGNTTLNANLSVSGEFKYTGSKTYTLQIPGNTFVPELNRNERRHFDGYVTASAAETDLQVMAPVRLPQGAMITAVEWAVYDSDGVENITDFDAALRFRANASTTVSTIASVDNQSTTGSSTSIQFFSDTGAHTVNNSANQYWVHAGLDYTAGADDLRFYGVKITYTLDTVAP